MAALCYWCVTNGDTPLGPPLGTCSDCWVLSCSDHAERDAVRGKWRCFDGVARLLTVAARFEAPDRAEEEPIYSPAELRERYPRIAAATSEMRALWSDRQDRLAQAAVEVARETPGPSVADGDLDAELLAEAVGIMLHYLPPRGEPVLRLELTASPTRRPGSGRLGRLLQVV